MHVHKGSAVHARVYVQADRHRCGDYYLAEGEGIAERWSAIGDGRVWRVGLLDGDGYERWVAGIDPVTGQPRGRVRDDGHANRFCEVTINGPKSWSLVAALVPQVAAAYDAAQERAATQVLAWLGGHLTYRVGRRGQQVQVPVDQLEAVLVRHHTSRAGEPHQHLHLQVNARVWGDGAWRGLHTVGMRDSLAAVNGIGHAAMVTDPQFRATLAAWGFTLDPATGEIEQLQPYVAAFSTRAAQIARNTARYEAEWRATHPNREPGAGLRRRWDAMAWADGRPQKKLADDPAARTARWLRHLDELGFTMPTQAARLDPVPVGRLDRDAAAELVLSRLAAKGSRWNAADIRGHVERLIAEQGVVADPAVRVELAEDLTARAVAGCVSMVEGVDRYSHVRHLSSSRVWAVEDELIRRLAARAGHRVDEHSREYAMYRTASCGYRLDDGQLQAVGAIIAGPPLVVIEGAAGAGKTTLLDAAQRELPYHRLLVVTPTRKAARVAAEQTGAAATSAAWLAYQHGWRWDEDGHWTRLRPDQLDPATGRPCPWPQPSAMLRSGDVLLVDEAGMLDQDTALALVTVADEASARLVLIGDRHQLPAVGRGGVLDHAIRWVHPDGYVRLDTVHRFTDPDYAELTLAMRAGQDPEQVFDALTARGAIRIHPDETARTAAVVSDTARELLAGRDVITVADTRAQVAELNLAIRDELVHAGAVDDTGTAACRDGVAGVGDLVVTRRNHTGYGVANRDTWAVTLVHPDGSLTVTGTPGERTLPASYVGQHVELGYAATVYAAQGDTVEHTHLVMGDTTGAAAAYVGMTRGRHTNTAHLVATDPSEAREQWTAAFNRDSADLGPAAAAHRAREDAQRHAAYRHPSPVLDRRRTPPVYVPERRQQVSRGPRI